MGAKGPLVRLELELRSTGESAPCRAVYVGTSLRAVERRVERAAAARARRTERTAAQDGASYGTGTAVPMD